MNLTDDATINNFFDSGGNTSLVVDDLFPVSPLIGPGSFNMGPNVVLQSASPFRVFTARQPLNTIQGPLNGAAFVPGTLFLNTQDEQWATYFFDAFHGVPFTVFYKDDLPSEDPIVDDIIIILETLAMPGTIATQEVFQEIELFDEFIKWSLDFENDYDKEEHEARSHPENSHSSFDFLDRTHNYIRRPARRDTTHLFYSPKEHF